MFKPISLAEQIVEHLSWQIIVDELPAGTRIAETQVASELGVSRGSTREALLLLERQCLVEITSHKGAVVTTLDGDEALEIVELLARGIRRLVGSATVADEALSGATDAARAMDQSAQRGDVEHLLKARRGFYDALLSDAGTVTRTLLAFLVPSSQRLIHGLCAESKLQLDDVSGFYGKLVIAANANDRTGVDELLDAFCSRVARLIRATVPPAGPQTRSKRYSIVQS